MKRPRRHERGAIVIEAMIAALIVSGMTIAMFETVTITARQTGAVAARQQAMLIARSQLATVGRLLPANPGRTRGVDSGMAWQVEISALPGSRANAAGQLTKVKVAVGPPGKPPLAVLSSLRLAR